MRAPDHSAGTSVKTVCSYCGVGCGMVLDVAADPATGTARVTRVSGDKSHPANAGRLCTKGASTADMLAAEGRLSTALVRHERGAEPSPVPVAEAIAETARRLRAVLDAHGPDALAMYVSGQLTLEAQYLANKLVKGFWRTNQIESNSRLCMASAGTGYKQSLGSDGPPGSYQDFDRADTFLVIGANMADCHPILFLRLLDRRKQGAKLIVVDPRRTATADKADLYLRIRPGTDLALLNGLLHLLVENGDVDPEFIDEYTEGWDAIPEFLEDYPPAQVSEITGIPEDDLRLAARWIGESGDWMSCWTMGLNQSTHGTWNTNSLCNLHLATGAICRPGSGPFSLTGQPNAMGGREMGYMGPGLPGQRSVLVDADREFVEDLWGVPAGTLRTDVGQGTVEMFSRMAAGDIKACWIICTNPVASVANRGTVIDGLEAAELVITQDVYADTETNAYADIVLPGAMWAESDGIMINSERTLTLLRPAVPAPGEALPDWKIIAEVAREMGFADAFRYDSAEEVFEEIKRAWNPATGYDIRGVSYERLRESSVQWPSAPGDDTGRNPVRYLNDGVSQTLRIREDGSAPALSFATPTGRARFFARPHLPAAELPDDDYPFVLNTGRVAHQWHTLTKTGRVAKLNKLNPGPFVEIHPEDAAALGVVDGDPVAVASRRGRAVLPASVSDRVRPGDCFAPFHWNDLFGEYLAVNAVTNDAVDPVSRQPEFKICAVQLCKVAAGPGRAGADDGETPSASAGGRADGTEPVRPAGVPAAVDRPGGDRVGTLAALLGVGDVPAPELAETERRYLAGFLAGLDTAGPPDSTGVPVLPADAPVDAGSALWVNGVLAGLFSRLPGPPSDPDQPGNTGENVDTGARPLLVLWASQTGNAEEFATTTAGHLAEKGLTPAVLSMADTTPDDVPPHADLLVITSTFGDGDAPDSGTDFWESLTTPDRPPFHDVRYAVLAFGDSSYSDFCGHGRRVDQRLGELGAHRIAERIDCEPDYDEQAWGWLDQVLVSLAAPPDPPTTPGPARASVSAAPAAPPASGARPKDTDRPRENGRPRGKETVTATLAGNRLLSLPGSAKEVRQFRLDADAAELDYDVGDALGVQPINHADLVGEWLAVTGLEADDPVDIPGVGEVAFAQALREHLDLAKITPNLLRFVSERTGDRDLKTLLRPGNGVELSKWMWARQAVDVAGEFPVRAGAGDWAAVLTRLRPRLYSISSSPLTSPGEVRLTVSVVRFDNRRGTTRGGVCSTYLADGPTDRPVPVHVQRSSGFRPPADPATPLIMVGPGTGIAPFLGFLQQRRALGHRGRSWLFFGEQREACDFYYRDELEELRRDGTLSRLDLAFSRDQRAKVYVQDRMREHGAVLWAWLNDGAHFYVCGDANRMAKDVDQALREIAVAHGGLNEERATAYVKRLGTEKRYLRDVY